MNRFMGHHLVQTGWLNIGDHQARFHTTSAARRHYERPGGLTSLLGEVDTPLGRRQFSRLLGVMVKEPFADEKRRPPSVSTHAVYAMQWKDDEALRRIAPAHWQFEFICALVSDERGVTLAESDAYEALVHYKYESSLGKFIFQAFRRRLCGDAKTSKTVRDAIAAAKKSGVKLIDPTTANISVGIASTVAVTVASVLPATIAAVGAPVIGAIALLLLQVGVDGFCEWSRQVIEEAEAQRPNET
jgi:hypothetical protein